MINRINHQRSVLPGDFTGQMRPQNIEQAAEQFEALLLRQMLKEMRNASDVIGSNSLFNSKQQRMMRDFYDDQLSGQLASQRSTGIAKMIISQLSPQNAVPFKDVSGMVALKEHPRKLNTPVVPVMRGGQE